MEVETREKFLSRKLALCLYFTHAKIEEITRRTGVDRKQLITLAKRCVEPAGDGSIWGFRALVPNFRTSVYTRRAEIKRKFPQQKGGMAGAMRACFMRFPEAETELVKAILQEKKRQTSEFRISAKTVHRIFLKILVEAGVSKNEWPFNTQHQGLRSVQKFMEGLLARNFATCVSGRESQVAQAHLSVGTGHQKFLSFDEPYDVVEIDSYKIESIFSVTLKTPENLDIDVPLERLWLIAAVDRASTAILAYSVVYRSEVTSDDILGVIRKAATGKWTPLELTIPGLKYSPKSGIPSGILENSYGAVWTTLMLDGALAHLAEKIYDKARKLTGFALNWGPVGHFERRANVERFFKQIGSDVFLRLPSTTGSNPHNGRASDAVANAVRHRINADLVAQVLDVAVANHNATPNEGKSYLSPLEVLQQYLADDGRAFMVRKLPVSTNAAQRFGLVREVVSVCGSVKSGRRPYVQIDRARYTSPVLAGSGSLIGRKLIVEIDEDDMRQVTAYLQNGAELGVLKAHGKWALQKHSRRTRRLINQLAYKRIITISSMDDPVDVLMKYLSATKKTNISARGDNAISANLPKAADVTALVRISREAGKEPRLKSQAKVGAAFNQQSVPYPTPALLVDMPSSKLTKIKNRR